MAKVIRKVELTEEEVLALKISFKILDELYDEDIDELLENDFEGFELIGNLLEAAKVWINR